MNILIVKSSAQGAASISGRLADHLAAEVQASQPGSKVVVRDVGAETLPHLTEGNVAGIRGEPSTKAEQATRALSDQLIAEVRTADLLVIASPMYNFGISSTLKTWFDHVLRARETFRYTENGPEGLLGGRQVVVIESRAGVYSKGDVVDLQEVQLKTLLGFVGLGDASFVRVEGLAFGPEAAEAAIKQAEHELSALAREALPLAA